MRVGRGISGYRVCSGLLSFAVQVVKGPEFRVILTAV